jgi:hypothetical protein
MPDTEKIKLVNQIEDLVKQRYELEGKFFTPYSQSFKDALYDEPISTLRSDYLLAQKNLKYIKEIMKNA